MSEDKIELTEEMVNTLENPPKANDAFKAAAKKYKGEDIKMADVFDLPYADLGHNSFVTDNWDQTKAAIHAINNHDKLTQQVAELRAALSELIDKASECDSWESFPSQYLDEANKALEEN